MSRCRLLAAILLLFCLARTTTQGEEPTEQDKKLLTKVYDIRYFLGKPEPPFLVGHASEENPGFRNSEPARRAALLVQSLVAALELDTRNPATPKHATIQIVNGNRLAIRTNAARHAEIADHLLAMRRLGDMSVIVNSRLYEVDETLHKKLKGLKRMSIDEMERRFLDGVPIDPEWDAIWKRLKKENVVLDGDKVSVDHDLEAAILSRHHVVSCLPGPNQLKDREKHRQAVIEGISFLAGIRVSADRRSVRLKLTEKAAEVVEIQKAKVMVDADKALDAEVPVMRESMHSEVFDIPDGGTILIPVRFRPRSMQEKERWWVLSITPRIYIEEEEEQIRKGKIPPIPRP